MWKLWLREQRVNGELTDGRATTNEIGRRECLIGEAVTYIWREGLPHWNVQPSQAKPSQIQRVTWCNYDRKLLFIHVCCWSLKLPAFQQNISPAVVQLQKQLQEEESRGATVHSLAEGSEQVLPAYVTTTHVSNEGMIILSQGTEVGCCSGLWESPRVLFFVSLLHACKQVQPTPVAIKVLKRWYLHVYLLSCSWKPLDPNLKKPPPVCF